MPKTICSVILTALLTLPVWLYAADMASDEQAGKASLDKVSLVESEDERCVANDGKMVTLQAHDLSQTLVVWIDRWFMGVQTADHTRHVLSKDHEQSELGCSITYSGPQSWSIYSVNLTN